jgi:predicted acylesterase/phospholipase RssA
VPPITILMQKNIFLALSGGGDNGAFAAGLLVGWSESGTRPTFKIVTGISTGALIASFAYLGSAYDPTITRMYADIERKDIFERRPMLAGLKWLVSSTNGHGRL